MSEKSFAFLSVSAAVVCGIFLYPPPPADMAAPALTAVPPAASAVMPAAHREHPLGKPLIAGSLRTNEDRVLTSTPSRSALGHGITAAAN